MGAEHVFLSGGADLLLLNIFDATDGTRRWGQLLLTIEE
jgi:hypothetical protein